MKYKENIICINVCMVHPLHLDLLPTYRVVGVDEQVIGVQVKYRYLKKFVYKLWWRSSWRMLSTSYTVLQVQDGGDA